MFGSRQRALEEQARQYGLRYDRERPDIQEREQASMPHGVQAGVRDAVSGYRGGHLVTQYSLTTYRRAAYSSEASTRPRRTHVTEVALPAITPHLRISLQRDAFTAAFGIQHAHDLVTGDPAFDDAFFVHTSDDRFARAVLAPGLRHWLLGLGAGFHPFAFSSGFLQTREPFDGALDIGRGLAAADYLAAILSAVPPPALHSFQPGPQW